MIKNTRSNAIFRWWWSIDSLMFILIALLIITGVILITTASPSVAQKIGANHFHFLYKQVIFLILSLIIMIVISVIDIRHIKTFVLFGFITVIGMMILVLFVGDEAKGAKRWITILGFSLQPSEILKPFYAVIIATILSTAASRKVLFNLRSWRLYTCLGLHACIALLLLMQPDFGMTITISLVVAGQLFVAGLPLIFVLLAVLFFILTFFGAYKILPHVAVRIDNFLNADGNIGYQVEKSLQSYAQGGLFGAGPGEGVIKSHLPDSHTDFIFAVAGEEMGAIFCCMIAALFGAIIVRAMMRASASRDLFQIYSIVGIMLYFGIQSMFNMGVTLHLFPTKGMTLPFISYGGSSALSFAIGIGIYLNLTKRSIVYRPASADIIISR